MERFFFILPPRTNCILELRCSFRRVVFLGAKGYTSTEALFTLRSPESENGKKLETGLRLKAVRKSKLRDSVD